MKTSELMQKYEDRFHVDPSYHVEAILNVSNGCCPGLPVLLTSAKRKDKKVFSAQCICGKLSTIGCKTADEAKALFLDKCVRTSIKEKKECPEYQRILEILEDYWLTEPTEEYVRIEMYFRKADGQEQEKRIVWRSPKYSQKLPGQRSLIRARDILEGKG